MELSSIDKSTLNVACSLSKTILDYSTVSECRECAIIAAAFNSLVRFHVSGRDLSTAHHPSTAAACNHMLVRTVESFDISQRAVLDPFPAFFCPALRAGPTSLRDARRISENNRPIDIAVKSFVVISLLRKFASSTFG